MRWIVALAAVVVVAGCSGSDGTGEGDRVDDILALTGDAAAGEAVYTANCAVCHGADGTGDPPSFPDITIETDEAVVAQQVLEGGEGMTPYDGVIPDQDIADVVAYVVETL